MACGTPVIASQVGGLPFLVQDGVTGFVIPNGEPSLLAERLTQLILDADLRDRMGQQAIAHAQPYAWPEIAKQILQLYLRILALSPSFPSISHETPL